MSENNAIIKLNAVRKFFKEEEILKGISFSIQEGEKLMITGSNGSGKTTLLRCILGLYKYEGEIHIYGNNVAKNRNEFIDKMAYVPQLPPPLSYRGDQFIKFISSITKVEEDIFYEMVKSVELDVNIIYERKFKKLSGGMQKKLLFALAMARRVPIIILDEPLTHVDPEGRGIIIKILNNIASETTVIYTAHSFMEEIIKTRVIKMDNGLIVSDERFCKPSE